jgi:hypothetical protein
MSLAPTNEETAWLNEEKNHIGKKNDLSCLSACDETRAVSLGTNNLSVRVCESGEKSCLLTLLNIYSLSRSSSNGFTLWIFILSILFPH